MIRIARMNTSLEFLELYHFVFMNFSMYTLGLLLSRSYAACQMDCYYRLPRDTQGKSPESYLQQGCHLHQVYLNSCLRRCPGNKFSQYDNNTGEL